MAPDVTDSPIDLQPDDRDSSGLQVDAATLVAAQIFGSPALPKGIPAVKAEFIIATANSAQRLDTAGLTLGGAFGGPLGEPTREERKRKIEEEALEYLSDAGDRAERSRELAREREEWSHTQHTFTGATMTGAEWSEMANDLKRDSLLRRWLVDQLMADGKTREQAEHKADEIGDLSAIMAKPKTEWTVAEREKIERANSDPEIQKIMPRLQDQRLNGPDSLNRADVAQADQSVSVTARSDLFASAPSATEHYQMASAATKPLDVPAPAIRNPISAPQPTAAAGLDI